MSLSEIFNKSYSLFSNNWKKYITLSLFPIIFTVFNAITNFMYNFSYSEDFETYNEYLISNVSLNLTNSALSLVSVFASFGIIAIILSDIRKEKSEEEKYTFMKVFNVMELSVYFKYLISSLLLSVGFVSLFIPVFFIIFLFTLPSVGLLSFASPFVIVGIIPLIFGLFLLLAFMSISLSFYPYTLIDIENNYKNLNIKHKNSILGSIKESWYLSQGYRFKLLLFYFILGILSAINISLLGIFSWVVIPFVALSNGIIYNNILNKKYPLEEKSINEESTKDTEDSTEDSEVNNLDLEDNKENSESIEV